MERRNKMNRRGKNSNTFVASAGTQLVKMKSSIKICFFTIDRKIITLSKSSGDEKLETVFPSLSFFSIFALDLRRIVCQPTLILSTYFSSITSCMKKKMTKMLSFQIQFSNAWLLLIYHIYQTSKLIRNKKKMIMIHS